MLTDGIMAADCGTHPRILIADDQPDLLEALRFLLKREGFVLDTVNSPEAALSAIRAQPFDLVLMDLNYTADTTSGREGIDLVSRIQAVDTLLPVVVMTGWGSVDLAVEAMRRGVRDFVQKPWDNVALVALLRSEVARGRERRKQALDAQREIAEARQIQRKLLPANVPGIDGLALATSWQPAAGVGGDCFDAIGFGSHRLGLSIADVVGKGIPAALLMSNLQAAVRAFANDAAEPGDLCQRVNRILCGHIADNRFITFFYCAIDTALARLTYTNAGHCPPILVRPDGTVERLTEGGVMLGVFADRTYDQRTVTFGPGDRLVLYTDGITEARGEDDEEFGEDRLVSLALRHRARTAAELEASLVGAVSAYTRGRFGDDATLIVAAAEGRARTIGTNLHVTVSNDSLA